MKQEDNALDDFLRQQVEKASFKAGEADWERMSALLDDEDGRKKKPFFWRGLSILIAVVLLGGAAWLGAELKKIRTAEATQQTAWSETSFAAAVPDASEKQVDKRQADTVDALKSQEMSANAEVSTSKGQATEAQRTQDGSELTKVVPQKEAKLNKSKGDRKIHPENIKQGSVGMESVAATTSVRPSVVTSRAAAKQERRERKENRKKERAREQGMANVTGNVGSSLQGAQGAHSALASGLKQKKTTDVLGRTMEVKEIKVYRPTVLEATGNYHPRYIAALHDYVAERIDSVQVITFAPLAKEEVAATPLPASQATPTKGFKPMPWEFFVMAGLNANQGLKGNQTTRLPWGLAPMVAFGVQRQLSPRLSLSTQVGFTYFNGLNLESRVVSYRYSFGVDSTAFTVSYRKLMQFYLPLTLSYSWRKGHDVLLSAGMTYATDMNGLVKENPQAAAYSANGYRNGFATLDVMAQAGYQYRINPRFAALLLWQQGFRDLTNNQYFQSTQSHRQSRLTLGLKYHFTRHGK